MPGQLTTILLIENCVHNFTTKFKITTGNAISRNEDGSDMIKYLYTIYYPVDESIKRYVPEVDKYDILYINNSKFYMNDENILSVIITNAYKLSDLIKPNNLPMVGLSVSMVGFSTSEPNINTKGTSVEIAMIENVGRDKDSNKQINKQFKIIIIHPSESRLSNITKSCKNGSRLFLSGNLFVINGNMIVELNNINFINLTNTIQATNESSIDKSFFNNENEFQPTSSSSHQPQRKNLAKEFFFQQEENQQQIQLPNQINNQNQLPNNQPTQQQLQLTNQTNNQPSLQQQPQQFQQESEVQKSKPQQESEVQQSKPQQESQQQFQQELELQQRTELSSQPTNQSVNQQQVKSSNGKKKINFLA